ncbi:class I SAM-dependent methyltransferase [Stutzerimonas zhaodongensis]|uniref:class I SAM-dependent methyltransferase n=1 Tax=Stutzerimonas TaxID=2901164 RepID=UPI00389055BD
MSDSVQLFSVRSDHYAQFRPSYPERLFSWLAERSPRVDCALDIAAGTGQATQPLLAHFSQVIACDASLDQLTASSNWQTAHRLAAGAEQLPLRDGVADLIVIAQALHWFATPAFFAEAKRVLAPDGLLCAWCYSLIRIGEPLDGLIDHLHGETLSGYWPPGRASVDVGYTDIQAPFATLEPPPFLMEAYWDLPQLLGYLRTWSAVKRWQQTHGRDPLSELEAEFRQHWSNPKQVRRVHWPLHFVIGYPGIQEQSCTTSC